MSNKLYLSQIRDLKKTRPVKLKAKEIQAKNKEAFDKSYFGSEYINKKKSKQTQRK